MKWWNTILALEMKEFMQEKAVEKGIVKKETSTVVYGLLYIWPAHLYQMMDWCHLLPYLVKRQNLSGLQRLFILFVCLFLLLLSFPNFSVKDIFDGGQIFLFVHLESSPSSCKVSYKRRFGVLIWVWPGNWLSNLLSFCLLALVPLQDICTPPLPSVCLVLLKST